MNEAEVRDLLAIPDDMPVAGSILAALESVPVPGNAAEIVGPGRQPGQYRVPGPLDSGGIGGCRVVLV